MRRARYSAWDGTQEVGEISGDDVLRRLMDDLLEHGDADQALRRLMQQGFVDGSGRSVAGLRELLKRARRQRAQLNRDAFAQLEAALSTTSPETLRRAREMLSELNAMVERHRQGDDIGADFDNFMQRYGDLVPGHPENLDQLLDGMANRLAATRALLESMSPHQRARLEELSEALLDADSELRLELDRLASNLALAAAGDPLMGLSAGFGPAGDITAQLSDLSDLEQLLAGAPSPGALAEVDINRARELLGAEDARSIEALGQLARQLRGDGLVEQREGRLRLTPRGLRRIGDQALSDLYSRLATDRVGQHPVGTAGAGHERAGETKAYEWGDPFNLSIERTVRNAVARHGPGTPIELSPADFEVERTEALSRSATVIMLDLSLSMPMRGNFVAAKKMAVALHSLISARYPSDYLGIVGFSRSAREISFRELPEVSWDYDWGTNIQHGLVVARQLLARHKGTRQIIIGHRW
jgi:uncharacterized protein with von Willebrand factor type A (vWA) domain